MPFTDDFERADGPLGDDWEITGLSVTNAFPMHIADGAAVGEIKTGQAHSTAQHVEDFSGVDQFIEIEIADLDDTALEYVELYTRLDDDFTNQNAYVYFYDGIPLSYGLGHYDGNTLGDFSGTVGDLEMTHPGGTLTLRLESDLDGDQRFYINGALVASVNDPSHFGPYVGFGIHDDSAVATPRILSVNAGDAGETPGPPPPPPFRFSNKIRPRIQLRGPIDWIDLHCHTHEMEFNRGRERFNDRFVPGTATLTISNHDGYGDLYGTPEEIAERELRPGRGIRLGLNVDGLGDVPMWTGIIDSCTPAYDPVEHDVVTVNAIDILGEVGSTKLLGYLDPVGAGDTPAARINRILDEAQWTATGRVLDESTTTLMGTTLTGQVIDLLGLSAESAGGAVFADVDGNIVFREFGWQLYSGSTPPDGVLGNDAGAVCPSGWEESFDRADIVTQVVLNRSAPEAVAPLNYTVPVDYDEGRTSTPGPGAIHMDGYSLGRSTEVYIHEITSDGLNAEALLRAITTGATIGIHVTVPDPHPTYRNTEWQATGPSTYLAGVYTIPVFTLFPPDDVDVVHYGPNQVFLKWTHLDADVTDDAAGISLYGLQNSVSLTDLICQNTDKFDKMRDGIFAVRGYTSMPRLDAVLLDAGHDHLETMQAMATCNPDTPSRYHCRLEQGGRVVFDRHMFATSVRHFMSPDTWTVRIGLDAADWAASTGGRLIFPGTAANYLSTPTIIPTALNDLEIIVRVQAAWQTAPSDYAGILYQGNTFGLRRQTGSTALAFYVYDTAGTTETLTVTPPGYWTNTAAVWLRVVVGTTSIRLEWTGDTNQVPAVANWQLLATQARTGTGIRAGTGNFVIGSDTATGTSRMFAGRVRRAIVRTGAEVPGAELSEPFNNLDGWAISVGTPIIVAGRNGPGAVELGFNTRISRAFTTPSDSVLIGFAVASNGVGSAILDMLQLYSGLANVDIALQITVAGALTVTGIASSADGLITDGVWNYVEIQVYRAEAPDGFVTVRLNGATVIAATGVDTVTYPSNPTFTAVELITIAGLHRFDDLYIKTGAGATFAGDQSVGISETVLVDVGEDDVADHVAATFTASTGETFTETGDVIQHPYIPVYTP